MAQAFAAQGYAVFQPDFRGSTNRGDALRAGYGQWGRKRPYSACQAGYRRSQARGDGRRELWRLCRARRRDLAERHLSPRRHAADADAPILLIHGKDDTVVPFHQSEAMASALRGAGKPVEPIVMKQEDHWLSRAATRKQMLAAAVAFVRKHDPPD